MAYTGPSQTRVNLHPAFLKIRYQLPNYFYNRILFIGDGILYRPYGGFFSYNFVNWNFNAHANSFLVGAGVSANYLLNIKDTSTSIIPGSNPQTTFQNAALDAASRIGVDIEVPSLSTTLTGYTTRTFQVATNSGYIDPNQPVDPNVTNTLSNHPFGSGFAHMCDYVALVPPSTATTYSFSNDVTIFKAPRVFGQYTGVGYSPVSTLLSTPTNQLTGTVTTSNPAAKTLTTGIFLHRNDRLLPFATGSYKVKNLNNAGVYSTGDSYNINTTSNGWQLYSFRDVRGAVIDDGSVDDFGSVVQLPSSININKTVYAAGGKSVANVLVSNAGLGYTTTPAVTVSAPQVSGGLTAQVTAIIDPESQTVIGFSVNNPGSGYTSAPTITIAPPNNTGTTATATATLTGGSLVFTGNTDGLFTGLEVSGTNIPSATTLVGISTFANANLDFTGSPQDYFTLELDKVITGSLSAASISFTKTISFSEKDTFGLSHVQIYSDRNTLNRVFTGNQMKGNILHGIGRDNLSIQEYSQITQSAFNSYFEVFGWNTVFICLGAQDVINGRSKAQIKTNLETLVNKIASAWNTTFQTVTSEGTVLAPSADFLKIVLVSPYQIRDPNPVINNFPAVNETKIGSGTAGSTAITVNNTTNLTQGMSVSGNGVANGTVVNSISGNTVNISQPLTANISTTETKNATGILLTNTIEVNNTNGLSNGMSVVTQSGTGIQPNTTITSISGNIVTLSQPLTADLTNEATDFTRQNADITFQASAYSTTTYAYDAANMDQVAAAMKEVADARWAAGYKDTGFLNLTKLVHDNVGDVVTLQNSLVTTDKYHPLPSLGSTISTLIWNELRASEADAPTFTLQTPPNQSGLLGSELFFPLGVTTTVPSADIRYRWQYFEGFSPPTEEQWGETLELDWQLLQVNNPDGTTSIVKTGTTNTLRLNSAVFPANVTSVNYYFRCIVTDAKENAKPAISGTISGTISANALTITQEPQAANVFSGTNATFTIAATSPVTINYSWEVSIDGGTNWSTITNDSTYSGQGTTTLTVSSVTTQFSGYNYRCVLTASGAPVTISQVAQLAVNASTISITQNVTSPVVTVGESTTIDVIAIASNGATIQYQWQVDQNDGNGFQDLVGSTNAGLTLTNITAAQNNFKYRVRLSAAGISPINSQIAILTVNAPQIFISDITTSPQSFTISTNNTLSVIASVTGPGAVAYQWRKTYDVAASTNNSSSSWQNIANSTASGIVATIYQTSFAGSPADRSNGWNGPNPPAGEKHLYQFRIKAFTNNGTVTGYYYGYFGSGTKLTPTIPTGLTTDTAGLGRTITVSSPYWSFGGDIPSQYGSTSASPGDSPTISWTLSGFSASSVTKFEILVEDLDASAPVSPTNPNGRFIHWYVTNIDPAITTIAQNGSWTVSGGGTGAQSPTLTLNGVTATGPLTGDDAYYQVVLTSPGAATVYSPVVRVNILIYPVPVITISGQPTNTAVVVGQSGSFSVSASATNAEDLQFSWQKSTIAATSSWSPTSPLADGLFTDIGNSATFTSGALTNSLSFTAQSGWNNYVYRCKVTAVYGNGSLTVVSYSNQAKLTVNPISISFTTLPVSAAKTVAEVTSANPLVFESTAVANNGATVSYQWQESTGGTADSDFFNISGATSQNLSLSSIIATQNNYKYRVRVSTPNYPSGTVTTTSDPPATLSILPPGTVFTSSPKYYHSVNGLNNLDVGTIVVWGEDTPPEGWLLCNGSTYAASTYPRLAQVLLNTHGGTVTSSDTFPYESSSKTFGVPDLRAKYLNAPGGAVTSSPSTYDTAITANCDATWTHTGVTNISGTRSGGTVTRTSPSVTVNIIGRAFGQDEFIAHSHSVQNAAQYYANNSNSVTCRGGNCTANGCRSNCQNCNGISGCCEGVAGAIRGYFMSGSQSSPIDNGQPHNHGGSFTRTVSLTGVTMTAPGTTTSISSTGVSIATSTINDVATMTVDPLTAYITLHYIIKAQ
jgi:phosphatidylethanolamine-binding protein (PEBP) family uncharacterized protein/microcystin-dependent protein